MWYVFFYFNDIRKAWLFNNYFVSWSSFRSFFLVFPSRLSASFDIQIDLKMKHPQHRKPIQKHIQNLVKYPTWKFLQK